MFGSATVLLEASVTSEDAECWRCELINKESSLTRLPLEAIKIIDFTGVLAAGAC